MLQHNGLQLFRARSWVTRNNPKEPEKTRPDVKRFTSREPPDLLTCFFLSGVRPTQRRDPLEPVLRSK